MTDDEIPAGAVLRRETNGQLVPLSTEAQRSALAAIQRGEITPIPIDIGHGIYLNPVVLVRALSLGNVEPPVPATDIESVLAQLTNNEQLLLIALSLYINDTVYLDKLHSLDRISTLSAIAKLPQQQLRQAAAELAKKLNTGWPPVIESGHGFVVFHGLPGDIHELAAYTTLSADELNRILYPLIRAGILTIKQAQELLAGPEANLGWIRGIREKRTGQLREMVAAYEKAQAQG